MVNLKTIHLIDRGQTDPLLLTHVIGGKWEEANGKGWGVKGEGKTLVDAHTNFLKALEEAVNAGHG